MESRFYRQQVNLRQVEKILERDEKLMVRKCDHNFL